MPDDVIKEDEAIELADLSVDRVDGVKGPATGQGWLVMKALDDQGQEAAPEAQGSDAGARAEHLDAHGASEAHAAASNLDPDDKANATEANEEAQGRDDNFQKADDPDADPGNPAWEAKDAAILRQAAQQLVSVSTLVDQAYGREGAEALSADDYDYADVSDLDCAKSALTHALGIVARLSFTEGAEGASVAKTADQVSNTVAALQNLLATGSSDQGDDMTEDQMRSLLADQTEQFAKDIDARIEKALKPADEDRPGPTGPVGEDEDVEKAAKAKAKAKPADDEDDDDDADDKKKPPVAKSEDSATTSTTSNTDDGEVLKSVVADAFKAAMSEDGPVGAVLKSLEGRIDTVERQPAGGGPLLRGAGALSNNALVSLRDDPTTNETAEMTQLRKAMDEAKTPVEKADFSRRLSIALARQFAGG